MIKIENAKVLGWEHAIRGMRNPLNSWDKMDSHECDCGASSIVKLPGGTAYKVLCPMYNAGHKPARLCENKAKPDFCIGENDHALMMRLAKAGGEHAKYRRMIVVYADVTAPRYWWAEYDTYKVGTVANSCSTMHKVTAKQFDLQDFSHEHLTIASSVALQEVIYHLNYWRAQYNLAETDEIKKECWWQIIQMLPGSYNQKRTIMLNYEVLANIYRQRKGHKLDEWRTFREWVEQLPYSELITGKEAEEDG